MVRTERVGVKDGSVCWRTRRNEEATESGRRRCGGRPRHAGGEARQRLLNKRRVIVRTPPRAGEVVGQKCGAADEAQQPHDHVHHSQKHVAAPKPGRIGHKHGLGAAKRCHGEPRRDAHVVGAGRQIGADDAVELVKVGKR